MKRLLLALVMASAGLFIGGSSAFATNCGIQSQTESMHSVLEHGCYEFFFNNSGSELESGSPVVFDGTAATGVNEGGGSALNTLFTDAARGQIDTDGTNGDVTNIGTYITTTTSADDDAVAGVIDEDSCVDQTYCRTQVRGPRMVRCSASTDTTFVEGEAVGTGTLAGRADAGSGLGVALSACADPTNDNTSGWVFINIGLGSN